MLLRPHSRRIVALLLVLLAWHGRVSRGLAIHPQRIVLDTYSDFVQGTAESVTVCDAGLLQPALPVEMVARLPADQLWAILPEADGSILVAASPDAKIFRIGQHRDVTLLASFPEHQIYAMARSPKGELFAATSPNGKIYRVPAKGEPVVYFDPKEKYIWSLLFDRDGTLYAGTGIGGKLFRIEGPLKGTLLCATGETHLRCLAWEKPGTLLAGSFPHGLLLRILPGGRAVALADSEREEVHQIVVSPDGSIFFSAVGTRHPPRAPGSSSEPGSATPEIWTPTPEASEPEEPPREAGRGLPLGMIKIAAPAPLSQVWSIDRSLVPRVIWGSREVLYSLLQAPMGLLAGMSGDGYVYRISLEGRSDRLLKIDAPAVQVAVLASPQQLLLGASNPARVFLAGVASRQEGVYRSAPLDAGNFARWGRLLVERSGVVEVRTRTGNTAKPDDSWYDWAPAPGGRCQNPAARYFQFELRLAQGSSVNRVQAVFLPYNLPPKLEKLQILHPGVAYSELPPPPAPLQARSLDQLLSQEGKPEPFDFFSPMPPRYQAKEARGLRTVVWKAEDPDGDDLRYSVFYRSEKETGWRLLIKDSEEPLFSWDTSGWPDGRYVLKVEASDVRDNAPGEGLTATLNSRPFLVDNTPPRIRILSSGGGKLRFRVSEDASGIRSVQISRDGREFLPIPPVDGILDSEEEEFELPLGKGESLFIRAEDEAGNVTSASANG
ncbi:MAG: WD40 repeat domain-containing protein [Methylacidiphilaceae bacterium]|nr:WD40 repeat domain-containing protein [Candidatus Methylacidiphilaceae bacterium]